MSEHAELCPACGTPKSGLLEDNCPTCLMRLGTPAEAGEIQDVEANGILLSPNARLGDYELVAEIARGGMGVVYQARQVALNRMVALKVLLGGQFAGEAFVKRFRHEAEAAASLQHPNIVSIYEIGQCEGQFYFSMELIEGRSLAELARENPLPARRAAQIVKAIADAVQFAHQRGVLHRDLKPSNVLIDHLDQPHITDFGLAKRVEADADLTLTGQVIGTPNYMPPEQADPRRGRATVVSDVYSLGALLYHLLTGRAPFMAETLTQTLRLVIEGEQVSPRLLNPSVPRDLETICLKCLEKEPKRRYSSAKTLADELARFLRDEPIHARPISAPAKLMRWCRRKPALSTTLGGFALLLLVVAVGSPVAIVRIDRARKQAETAHKQEALLRSRAESAERQTQQQLHAALLEQARATVRSGDLGQRVRALEALSRAAAISNTVELRREVFAALALPDLSYERDLPVGANVTLAELDPRFERIAIGHGLGPMEIRSTTDQRLLATLPASTNLQAHYAEWSSDGRLLAVKRDYAGGGEHSDWEVWNAADAKRLLLLRDVSWNAVTFHPRLDLVLAEEGTNEISAWNLATGVKSGQPLLRGLAMYLRFSPDGQRLACVYRVNRTYVVSIHDATTGVLLSSHTFPDYLAVPAWNPTGRWLAVADHGGAVHAMDAQTGETRTLGRHKAQAVLTVFSPDGKYLITGGWERELVCWDAEKMERAFTIGLNSYTLQFRSDGRECALTTRPGTGLHLHAFEVPAGYREFPEDLGRVMQATFSSDGRWLAASGQKRLGVWDTTANAPGALLDRGAEARVFFKPGSSELFASAHNDCFRLSVSAATQAGSLPELRALPLMKPQAFESLCLSSNLLVWTGSNGSCALSLTDSVANASQDGPWKLTLAGINGASPDGKWLGIHRSFTPLLEVYRLPALEPVATLSNRANIARFKFSPSGNELAIISLRHIDFWSTTTWQRTRELTDFIDLMYAPDPRTLWLAKDFRTAGLYDARTLTQLLPLPTGMLPLALSPDGRHLAVSVDARRLQVWDLEEVRSQLRNLGMDWSEPQVAEQRSPPAMQAR